MVKARWILPFIMNEMADMPNMSNREVTNLIADYIIPKFLTASLLQSSRTSAREEIF